MGGRVVLQHLQAQPGGAALPPGISRIFIGLGLPILQGYGLTETAPIVSLNHPFHLSEGTVGNQLWPALDVQPATMAAQTTTHAPRESH